nr:uncharacterized protein LOC111509908 [Leptinotarsa decemlineata]XP_023021533.1 uncharacterized protein LOC111509908 [Leptinotarsa decemlineata]
MAVPFVMPEDENEVEVIIIQLQSLLTKLQAALRRSRGPPPPRTSLPTRNRTSAGSSRSPTQDQGTSTSASAPSTQIPDLLNNLALLAAASQEIVQSNQPEGAPQVAASATFRSTRRRTNSESSCCEESKVSITTANRNGVQDWNQVNEPEISSAKTLSSESIFSKFVPGPVSAPLWTAMICFVGWHLFGTR